ncbi:Gfo/Idh/MocA family oxidoreductase [Streptomyces sp. NPDC052040]|uniref:Gfo/Idh/MocA family oxidoreductase n=1 Tax=unclassified Streptomyces TaxID=2593676 RepID=UPI0037D55B0A
MRVAIIGIGRIGRLHAGNLRAAGHRTVTVDRAADADFRDVRELPDALVARIDAWVVSTPTRLHLRTLRQILTRAPAARVLLEKPAVIPSELAALTRTLDEHPGARVVVNNVYAHSAPVRHLAGTVLRLSASDPIARITVEFTKNRLSDVAAGRFVDNDYGEVGYEWFHMLAILRELLSPEDYRAYLDTPGPRITREVRVGVAGRGLPDIELYSSMCGRVGFPRLAGPYFASAAVRHEIATGAIGYGTDLRYRFADVELASGTRCCLVYEPYYAARDAYKNTHAVVVSTGTGVDVTTVAENQLATALAAQLRALTSPNGGTNRLYQAEHAHMARLAAQLGPYEATVPHPAALAGDMNGATT